MQFLADWMCGAGQARAIELFGGPTSLCARCTGFFLAIAVGVWLRHVVQTQRAGLVARIALLVVIAATLVQLGVVDLPWLRLLLGAAIGLPLGFIAASRIAAPIRAPLATFGAMATLCVLAAAVVGSHAVLDFAMLVSIALASVLVLACLIKGAPQ